MILCSDALYLARIHSALFVPGAQLVVRQPVVVPVFPVADIV